VDGVSTEEVGWVRFCAIVSPVYARDRVYRDGGDQGDDRGPARGAAIGSGADGSVRQPWDPLRKFQRTS
jgi:hypothetical protein